MQVLKIVANQIPAHITTVNDGVDTDMKELQLTSDDLKEGGIDHILVKGSCLQDQLIGMTGAFPASETDNKHFQRSKKLCHFKNIFVWTSGLL